MKVLLINSVCGIRSTGRICADIAKEYESEGHEVRIAYGRVDTLPQEANKWGVKIGGVLSRNFHALMTRLYDIHGNGVCSAFATRKFIKWAESWKPDLVWLHNIHGYYLNYELLFEWIKRHPELEVKWTLHDCWAFTGHCAYFTASGCDRWETRCHDCPEKKQYPASFCLDASWENWELKRSCFTGVKNLSLITPSKWLADLTRHSFLNEYPVEVVHNTIDTGIFKPTQSNWRKTNDLDSKVVVLGVASIWDRRKGLQDFLSLRKLLGENYVIVLVGLTARQIAVLPEGIIGITRTDNATQLAEIYSAADWFFNPTHEDNYPTVNLEARSCGCRIATYDTGGSAETVEGYDKAWVLTGGNHSPEGFVQLLHKEGY